MQVCLFKRILDGRHVNLGIAKQSEKRGKWCEEVVKHSHISVVGVALALEIGQSTDPCST